MTAHPTSRRAPFLLQRYVLGELILNLTVSLVVITSVFFVGMLLQSLYRFQELPWIPHRDGACEAMRTFTFIQLLFDRLP